MKEMSTYLLTKSCWSPSLHYFVFFNIQVVKNILPPGGPCWVLLYKHDFHRWRWTWWILHWAWQGKCAVGQTTGLGEAAWIQLNHQCDRWSTHNLYPGEWWDGIDKHNYFFCLINSAFYINVLILYFNYNYNFILTIMTLNKYCAIMFF